MDHLTSLPNVSHSCCVSIEERVLDGLKNHTFFMEVDRERLRTLFSRTTIQLLQVGDYLFRAKTSANCAYVLLEGSIQIEFARTEHERGYVGTVLKSPSFLGEAQLLHEPCWVNSAVVLSPLLAVSLTLEDLKRIFVELPNVAFEIYKDLSFRFNRVTHAFRERETRTPEQELARYLIARTAATVSDPKDPLPRFVVKQAELGSVTGLRREVVNSILKVWENAGIVSIGRGSIAIHQVNALLAECGDVKPLLELPLKQA